MPRFDSETVRQSGNVMKQADKRAIQWEWQYRLRVASGRCGEAWRGTVGTLKVTPAPCRCAAAANAEAAVYTSERAQSAIRDPILDERSSAAPTTAIPTSLSVRPPQPRSQPRQPLFRPHSALTYLLTYLSRLALLLACSQRMTRRGRGQH